MSVDGLRLGMYVAELDRPWTETPFLFQGFVLRTEEELATMRRFCNHVYVDEEKNEGAAVQDDTCSLRGTARYPQLRSVEEEFPAGHTAYVQCAEALHKAFAALELRGEPEAERLKGAVANVVDSVIRNADAMLLLAKMRHKAELEFRRALDAAVLMITFGRFLQLERRHLEALGLAGLLQDVGKLRVPSEVLTKQGPLTLEEYELVKAHVSHSVEILRTAGGFAPEVAEIVLLHHERQDGSGYPRGLSGPAIGLYGSMAGIVDSYSSLTCRAYPGQMSPSNALSELYRVRGRLFHAALVEQFIQCIGIYPVGSVVELNSGEIGIVVAQNQVRRLQPRVMVVLDRERKPIHPHKMLDLLKDPTAAPGEPYRIRRTLEADQVTLDPRELFL